MLKTDNFFDLKGHKFEKLFEDAEYIFDGLKNLKNYIKSNLKPNVSKIRNGKSFIDKDAVFFEGKVFVTGFTIDSKNSKVTMDGKILDGASIIYAGVFLMDDEIYIGKGNVIEPGALIKGPTIIEDNNQIRQGSYIRGNVLIGDECVVGHSTEIKSSVLLGKSVAAHFAYVGDSILGKVNLGAGTKLANLKIFGTNIVLTIDGAKIDTGLRKFGAILSDGVETGCNSVTDPGTILGKNTLLYPNSTAKGFYPSDMIIKLIQDQKIEKRK
jgi:UDP-N-acetylglucosamine diphosphorylase / glucose-1-phosphate thymidylyltransferase / UDP-N-acetylgalactosamine diphosphorylase / glucosamine-1-phosphate N-acetyltransferase / galactosamine-1-phosphate N-acetyltransferase